MLKKTFIVFALFFTLANMVFASPIPERQNPARWVNNLSVLDKDQLFLFLSVLIFIFFATFYVVILIADIKKTKRNFSQLDWGAVEKNNNPKYTVKNYFLNPYNPNNYKLSWLITLVLLLLIGSLLGILIIVAIVVIAKKRKMSGYDSQVSSQAYSGSSSGWSSSSSSSPSSDSSSSDFGGGSFGGGGSGGNW